MDYTSTQNYVSVLPPAGQNQGFVTQQPQTQYGMGTQNAVQGQIPNFMALTGVKTIPAIITTEHFNPYDTLCPHCRSKIKTKVDYKIGGQTWLCCFIIGISGAPCACCIPYFMDSCKDATHSCPTCSREILTYKRLECTPNAKVAYFNST